jgi:hypothetical protein
VPDSSTCDRYRRWLLDEVRRHGAPVVLGGHSMGAALSIALSTEMQGVRRHRIPTTVIGCVTDTLVTIRHCRQAARLLGADWAMNARLGVVELPG